MPLASHDPWFRVLANPTAPARVGRSLPAAGGPRGASGDGGGAGRGSPAVDRRLWAAGLHAGEGNQPLAVRCTGGWPRAPAAAEDRWRRSAAVADASATGEARGLSAAGCGLPPLACWPRVAAASSGRWPRVAAVRGLCSRPPWFAAGERGAWRCMRSDACMRVAGAPCAEKEETATDGPRAVTRARLGHVLITC